MTAGDRYPSVVAARGKEWCSVYQRGSCWVWQFLAWWKWVTFSPPSSCHSRAPANAAATTPGASLTGPSDEQMFSFCGALSQTLKSVQRWQPRYSLAPNTLNNGGKTFRAGSLEIAQTLRTGFAPLKRP